MFLSRKKKEEKWRRKKNDKSCSADVSLHYAPIILWKTFYSNLSFFSSFPNYFFALTPAVYRVSYFYLIIQALIRSRVMRNVTLWTSVKSRGKEEWGYQATTNVEVGGWKTLLDIFCSLKFPWGGQLFCGRSKIPFSLRQSQF